MLGRVVAAAIQLEAFWATSEDDFRLHLTGLLEDARREGAELVALPQHLGMSLLGMLGPATPDVGWFDIIQAAGYESLMECYQAEGAALVGVYEQIGSELAREFQLYLVFGSMLMTDQDGHLFDVAYLFAPDGKLVGKQQRTHLSSVEDGREWCGGDVLSVFDTPVGRIGLVIGADVYYPEVSRILCLQGANVLIHLHRSVRHSQADWMRRLWREVQANQVYGIESCLVGRGDQGRATIHAPLGITLSGDGVLACATSTMRSEVVVAELDYLRLQQVVDDYRIYSVLNYEMYRKWLPLLYESDGAVATGLS